MVCPAGIVTASATDDGAVPVGAEGVIWAPVAGFTSLTEYREGPIPAVSTVNDRIEAVPVLEITTFSTPTPAPCLMEAPDSRRLGPPDAPLKPPRETMTNALPPDATPTRTKTSMYVEMPLADLGLNLDLVSVRINQQKRLA